MGGSPLAMSLGRRISTKIKAKTASCKIQVKNACLHENPVPGVSIILKDLHSDLIGVEQIGDASEEETGEYKLKEGRLGGVSADISSFFQKTLRSFSFFTLLSIKTQSQHLRVNISSTTKLLLISNAAVLSQGQSTKKEKPGRNINRC